MREGHTLSSELAISVNSLVKAYGEKIAVNDVSFEVRKGEIFGYLGPNGAGKTTTIKVLTTLLQPDGGKVKVLGYDVSSESSRIRRSIGVVQQQPSLEMFMTVEQNLDSCGFLWDVPKNERKTRIQFLTELFGLKECLKSKGPELSIGQRKRLQVAREFMHDMEILFLDEPTTGLDPQVRRTLLDHIKKRAREGLTVFFTTHIMEEAQYLCDRVAIIDHGKILSCDTVDNLRAKFGGGSVVELTLAEREVDPSEAITSIEGVNAVQAPQEMGEPFRISTDNPSRILPPLMDVLSAKGLHVVNLNVKESTLEETFLRLTSRKEGTA
jgi:ABC-2 type transport system ATP-binding protein